MTLGDIGGDARLVAGKYFFALEITTVGDDGKAFNPNGATRLLGQGLALARSVMVKDYLEAGRLIRPFVDKGLDCPLTQAYYVVYRPECGELPKVQAFRDWLIDEAKAVYLLRGPSKCHHFQSTRPAALGRSLPVSIGGNRPVLLKKAVFWPPAGQVCQLWGRPACLALTSFIATIAR